MEDKNILKRQLSLFVTTCFVLGFIVGTGIFYLPGRVLFEVGGNVYYGLLAWVIGGITIAPCVYMFSQLASKYETMHGFVDYSEELVGRRYGYLAGWFFAVMYQPAGYAIISWITSGFVATLLNIPNSDPAHFPFRFFITTFFMIMTFVMNYINPKLAVRYNTGTVLARMIPLIAMAVFGIFIGLVSLTIGLVNLFPPISSGYQQITTLPGNIATISIFGAISATAFAFNGWQASLAFNSEVIESRKKLPKALMIAFGIVIILYVGYFYGVITNTSDGGATIMQGGGENFAHGTHDAFRNVFGNVFSNILIVFMIISGLGILNGCCLSMSRAMHSLGRRGLGPLSHRTILLDIDTNVPNTGMVLTVGIGFLWLIVIYMNTFVDWFRFTIPDFYNFSFFGLMIPIFIAFIIREKYINPIKRFVVPFLGILGAGFMFSTYWLGNWSQTLTYLCVFLVLGIIGFLLAKR